MQTDTDWVAIEDKKDRCFKRMNELVDKAKKRNRKLTTAELGEYNNLEGEFRALSEVLENSFEKSFRPKTLGFGERSNRGGWNVTDRDLEGYSLTRAINKLASHQSLDGVEGEINKELQSNMGRRPTGHGLMVPINALLPKRKAALTDNSNTVATEKLGLIGILRERLVVGQMGATILDNLQGDVEIPRQTGKAALSWKGETTAVDESTPTFDQISMEPHKAGTFTEYSRQLLAQNSFSIEQFVRDDIFAALQQGIDLAALNGTGSSNQPTGILQDSNVTVKALGTNGAAMSYADIVDMETLVSNDNADVGNLGYVTNTALRGKLKSTEISSNTGRFVWEGNQLNGYAAMASNQIPSNLTKGTGSSLSAIIFGNFSDLIVGSWGPGIELLVNPYSKDKEGVIRIVGFSFVDVGIRHPESFCRVVDAVTS